MRHAFEARLANTRRLQQLIKPTGSEKVSSHFSFSNRFLPTIGDSRFEARGNAGRVVCQSKPASRWAFYGRALRLDREFKKNQENRTMEQPLAGGVGLCAAGTRERPGVLERPGSEWGERGARVRRLAKPGRYCCRRSQTSWKPQLAPRAVEPRWGRGTIGTRDRLRRD
jgi:hypothetical protein